jgi:hypothetical protein
MRRPEGITIIALWFFLCTGLCVLGVFGIAIGFIGLWTGGSGDGFSGVLLGTMGMMLGELAVVTTAIAFGAVGWGLWRLKSWSRGGAIVLASISIIFIPFGTIAGIMILVYLNRNREAKAAFGIPAGHTPAGGSNVRS